jgi:hypothetical protein
MIAQNSPDISFRMGVAITCPYIAPRHGQQAGRLGCARILADEVLAAGRLEEALAGFVDLDWSGRRVLGSDRTREHIGEDAAGMVVLAPGA